MRHILSSILLLLFHTLAWGQQEHRLNIRGVVLERSTLEALEGATARLYDSRDSLLMGSTTQKEGRFTLPNVPSGKYTLRVSFMGYNDKSFSLTLPQRSGNFRVEDVLLSEVSTTLREAVVEGKMPEMSVVDDTVVYHADAFKVGDGDMVEELVKKLPGVVLQDDGTFTFNGKPINQILVDGKEFFGNNRDFVLKNLPAEIIDKIKAYDRKSDRARITGIDDGEERTVLDLTVRKNRKRGFFGNANGGYGSADRYRGQMNMNHFVGDQKVSLFGNANNTNGDGRSNNQSLGASMNWQNKKIELNGSVNANFSQSERESKSNSQNFELQNAAYSNNRNYNNGHNFGGNFQYKVEWKPDTMWNILIRPELSWGGSNSSANNESATFHRDPYQYTDDPLRDIILLRDSAGVNHRLGSNINEDRNINASASVQINRRLAKPGRNITLSFGGGYNSNTNDSRNYTQTEYYLLQSYTGEDSVYHKTQFNQGRGHTYRANAHVSYSEPIAHQVFLQLSYSYNYNYRTNNRDVRSIFDPYNDLAGVTVHNYPFFQNSPYAVADKQQTSHSSNTYHNHDARLQLRINRTRYQLTIGANLQPQSSTVDYNKGRIDTVLTRSVVNVAPTLNFRYKFSQNEQLNLRYNGNTGQPNMTDMIPDTLSDANPLNIHIGNARLKPSFAHHINFGYNRAIPAKQRSYALNMQYHITQNSTTNRTEYNEQTGGRVSMPVNVDGNWDASANFDFNTAIDTAKHWFIFSGSEVRGSTRLGYLYRSKTHETVENRTRTANLGQRLRLTYRYKWESKWEIESSLSGAFYYHINRSNNATAQNLDNHNFNYGFNLHLQTPWGMELRTDITEHSRRGFSDAAMNTNQLIWGATLSQRFLKHKNLTVSLQAVDILGQRDDINRNVSATSRTDTQNNIVRSYVIGTVNLRFGRFGGRRANRQGNAERRGNEQATTAERSNRERSGNAERSGGQNLRGRRK